MDTMTVVWAVLIVIFLVVEGATAGLTSIWFAAGALAALAVAFLDAPVWLQIMLFVVVSIATLLLTRPFAKQFVSKKIQPANADKIIGTIATVTERIDNILGAGTVSVGGRIWMARSETGDIVKEGTLALVTAIQGAKVIVAPLTSAQTAEILNEKQY